MQVLLLVLGDMPLGKRPYWPIYAAAERLGLAGRHPCRQHLSPSADRRGVGLLPRGLRRAGAGFQAQLTSLIVEGVFASFRG